MAASATNAITRAITSWTPGIKPSWTVGEVRQALRSHADGNFYLSARLVDAMGEDDAIPSLLDKRVNAVLRAPFSLEPVDAPNRQLSKAIVRAYEPVWWDMFPEAELAELLRWYRMLGVGLGVLDYTASATRWTATLRVLHPQFLRRDQERQVWLYQAREGELLVTPGDGKWVLITDGQRGWMRGQVRQCAIDWIAKQLTIRDWNRYNERHGLPLLKALSPAVADDADRDQFWEDVKDIGADTVVQLSTHINEEGAAYDLQLLEATDRNWQTFEATLNRIDRRFTIAFLGGNLSTEVDGQGSYAAATSHGGELSDLATGDAEKLSTELRRQGLAPVVGANVSGATLEVTPWPMWATEPPEDQQRKAETLSAAGDALRKLQEAGLPVDEQAFAEEFDVPLGSVKAEAAKGLLVQYLTHGIVTINEVRARLGMPPIAGGDKPPIIPGAETADAAHAGGGARPDAAPDDDAHGDADANADGEGEGDDDPPTKEA